MVYAISYCPVDFEAVLKSHGFDDSKVLTAETRERLLETLCKDPKFNESVGWGIHAISARDIASGMLRPLTHGNYNLNEQAHDTTMSLIQQVLDKGVNITQVFVDTVGPPSSYQAKLSKRFPSLKITVTKKADSLFPIVSAASICAKVTRDQLLDQHELLEGASIDKDEDEMEGEDEIITGWGSGYPSDPRTSSWLNSSVDPVFGWSNIVRFSWQTARDVLVKKNCVKVEWADDLDMIHHDVSSYFVDKSKDPNRLDALSVTTRIYGSSVEEL